MGGSGGGAVRVVAVRRTGALAAGPVECSRSRRGEDVLNDQRATSSAADSGESGEAARPIIW